jgi:hypothetical protein
MMTIRFPDISGHQAGIPLDGGGAVIVKATEGTGYTNPDYVPAKARAASAGAFLIAYHFLHAGGAAAQAAHCHAVAGSVPLMLDMEEALPDGGLPTVPDAVAFTDAYRKLGGVIHLLYLPHWYWQRIGSPPLAPLADRGLSLVSSNYTGYSDDGPGWASYGGMTPAIWQYTSSATFNGWHPIDMNAFKGTTDMLITLATGTKATQPPPSPAPEWPAGVILRRGDTSEAVRALQIALNATHLPGVRNIVVDGAFGRQTLTSVRNFQGLEVLAVDGIAGKQTRDALIRIGALTA